MAEQIHRTAADGVEEGGQVECKLRNGVALERARLGGAAVAALVQDDDTPALGQGVDLQREVVGRAGVAVDKHQGGCARQAGPPL